MSVASHANDMQMTDDTASEPGVALASGTSRRRRGAWSHAWEWHTQKGGHAAAEPDVMLASGVCTQEQ